jgi:hypothetical protein
MKLLSILSFFWASIAISSEHPHWIMEPPIGFTNDYFVGVGRSMVSESEARNTALADALHRIVQSGTITLQATQSIKTKSSEKFKDGQSVSLDVIDDVVNDIRIVGESKIVKGLREEEYFTEEQNGMYIVWSLVKIPKNNPKPYVPTSKFAPVWRSAILPSWGQFYKGEPTKGYLIAGSTVVLVSSGLILSNLKITSESDAKNSRTQVLRDYYNNQSNTYNNISIACFIAATAVYVYNIVDAVVTDGQKLYVEQPKNSHEDEITLVQKEMSNHNYLFSIRFNF